MPFELESLAPFIKEEIEGNDPSSGMLKLLQDKISVMASLLHGFAENNIQENEMKEDIKSMTLPELTTWMSALGEKGFGQNSFITGCIRILFLPLMR